MKGSITVIMPAYEAAHYMERSLPPLVAMLEAGEIAELIVVDDCSPSEKSADLARSMGAKVLKMPKNGGPGAARNFASQFAQGEILWFVDADVVVRPDSAGFVRKAFDDDGVVAAFGSYDDRPPAKNFASQYKNLVHRYYHQRAREDASTFWAGCGAVRRGAFLASGGFDGRMFKRPSIEDIELGYRLIDAGGRIKLVHELVCTHLKQWRLEEVIHTDIFKRALPWARLLLSRGPRTNDLNVSDKEKIKAVVAGLFFVGVLAAPFVLPPPAALAVIGVLGMLVVAANIRLLNFFAKAKGVGFAALATLYHQVYYCYSAGAYAWCVAEFAGAPRRARRPVRIKGQRRAAQLAAISSHKAAGQTESADYAGRRARGGERKAG